MDNPIGFQLLGKMPKLRTFRDEMLDILPVKDILEIMPELEAIFIGKTNRKSSRMQDELQNICNANKIFRRVKNLVLLEVDDPTLLEGLAKVFPNLESLKVDTDNETGFHGGENEMKLDVVLKACGAWGGLKHLNLGVPAW